MRLLILPLKHSDAQLFHLCVALLVLIEIEKQWLVLWRLDQVEQDFRLHHVHLGGKFIQFLWRPAPLHLHRGATQLLLAYAPLMLGEGQRGELRLDIEVQDRCLLVWQLLLLHRLRELPPVAHRLALLVVFEVLG